MNGFKNWETWVTAEWLRKDKEAYNYYKNLAVKFSGEYEYIDEAIFELKINIEANVKDGAFNIIFSDTSLYGDILAEAIPHIDFGEVAECFFNEYYSE